MQSVTLADAGRQVALSVGESVAVVLAGNPTTGYQWEVVALDESIVKQLGRGTFEPSSTALGAGGQLTLRFQGAGAGQTSLKLVYRRPFEKHTPPAQTFEIQVVVK